MKTKNNIPDDYFDNQEFIVSDIDENLIIGILGKNPSSDQMLKFLFCTYISKIKDQKKMSLTQVESLTNINASDVSRIKNHHIDRFTIDRLMKICSLIDNPQGVGKVLSAAGEQMSRAIV
jgi:predicted XRE-type DNA-binding protein